MKDKIDILYFADQWDDKWRRRQRLAIALSEQECVNKLYYVELPLSLASFFKYLFGRADNEARKRWARVLKKGFTFCFNNIIILTPFSILPFYRAAKFHSICLSLYKKTVLSKLPRDFKPSLVWASLPSDSLLVNDFNNIKCIYDCSENFVDFIQWRDIADKIREWDLLLTQRSDIVFVQTNTMFDIKKHQNKNTFLLENGCDIEAFINKPAPIILNDIKRPILGYTGSINDRINYKMIEKVADLRPDWNFVFVGPVDKVKPMVKNNIHFIGEVTYQEMAGYVNNFDVCIMPHQIKGVSESQSPLKLFDYLAAGKPIVSTSIQGVNEYRDLLLVADDVLSFIGAIERALVEKDKEMKIRRQDRARDCTWVKRGEEMLTLLKSINVL